MLFFSVEDQSLFSPTRDFKTDMFHVIHIIRVVKKLLKSLYFACMTRHKFYNNRYKIYK